MKFFDQIEAKIQIKLETLLIVIWENTLCKYFGLNVIPFQCHEF